MLERNGGFLVVGLRSHRQQLADLTVLAPNVVLLDMETRDSSAIIRDLKHSAPHVPIVAVGVSDADAHVLACMEAGADGYVDREGSLETLIAAIESAARGELHCSPRVAGGLLRRLAALACAREPIAPAGQLTVREGQIVQLIVQNLSNKEIASRLGIEVATVKNHVHNLLEKLNVRRRVDVARSLSVQPAFSSGTDPSRQP